jgi:hypothetical protein
MEAASPMRHLSPPIQETLQGFVEDEPCCSGAMGSKRGRERTTNSGGSVIKRRQTINRDHLFRRTTNNVHHSEAQENIAIHNEKSVEPTLTINRDRYNTTGEREGTESKTSGGFYWLQANTIKFNHDVNGVYLGFA